MMKAPTPSPHNSTGRLADLDGVRAIAIWMVLTLHMLYGYANGPTNLDFVPAPLRFVASHGWLGVDLFFVLSGFLITGILLGSKKQPHYFRNFYIRRVLRIMPLYFTVVAVWAIFYTRYEGYFLLSSIFCANLSHVLHVRTPHGPSVLWSLAIEEQFYLFWPLIVFLTNRRTLLFLTSAIIIVSPVLRAVYAARGMNPEIIYVVTCFRLDGLAVGALLALFLSTGQQSRRLSVYVASALMLCFVAMTIIGKPYGLLGTKTVVSIALRNTQAYLVFAAFMIVVLAYRNTIWTSPLRWRFLQLSGALSYCLYLIHLSIGDGYEALMQKWHIDLGKTIGYPNAVMVRAFAILTISFAIAMLSRKYLEQPFLSLKDRFTEAAPVRSQVVDEEADASLVRKGL